MSSSESGKSTRIFQRKGVKRIGYLVLVLSIACISWGYGVLSLKRGWFPYPQVQELVSKARLRAEILREHSRLDLGWFYYRPAADQLPKVKTYIPDAVSPEPLLVYGIDEERQMRVKIIDNDGLVLHEWPLDIFELWPDMEHVPPWRQPIAEIGGEIVDGLEITQDGDIVFNYEPFGLFKLGFCGDVKWKIPTYTHHSVHLDQSGNLVVLEQLIQMDPHRVDLRNGPYKNLDVNGRVEAFEENVLIVAPDGSILERISINDLLLENGLDGLYYLSAEAVYGVDFKNSDLMHSNDAETFPLDMEEGFFGRGDVVVSLHNLNTIFVFNIDSRKIKFVHTGSMIMQHDPDFISGNEISVFDNHPTLIPQVFRPKRPDTVSSRILIIDALTGKEKVFFQGGKDIPFFSDNAGRHQWLPNGNLLITEARWGRVFELSPEGELVWEYNNILDSGLEEGLLGITFEGRRLPSELNADKLRELAGACDS